MNLNRHWNPGTARAVALVSFVLLLSLSAVAELGGDVRSVQTDQQRMNATRRVNAMSAYSVHEIRTGTSGVAREYVSPDGKVFAIFYHGPFLGEGNQLLASYAQQIAPALQSVHKGQHRGGPITVRLPNLVYHLSGHMRSYTVRAYLPGSVPQGVNLEELQ
jgi:hypothetical protein